ncbi:hypothetical protein PybrP1_011320, partial [[Pythium] brassicae (nom. inval.)]
VASAPAQVPQSETQPEVRRRKPLGSSRRKEKPSLMKQLLWKVKAPTPAPAPAPATSVADDAEELVLAQVREDEENDEDEEVAFAAEERHALKRKAASLAQAMLSRSPVESSSQETQSGSEDESLFVQYSLLSSDDAHEPPSSSSLSSSPAAFRVDLADSCFPTPLSLESVAGAKARSPKAQVHEVLLDNFALSPAELSIVKGDLVVWRVSEQTLGMAEHALDATLFAVGGAYARKTSTPLLGPGSGFAWRLDVAGRLEVECSVYKTQCTVLINEDAAAKRRFAIARASKLVPADALRHPKKLSTRAKRAAKLAREALAATARASSVEEEEEEPEAASGVASADSVEVFHRSTSLACVPELDAGVCREVLAQLDDVRAAAGAAEATGFIVVGDVACPVAEAADSETSAHDRAEAAAIDDDDDAGGAGAAAPVDDVVDFQQRIIAMLQKSEEAQVRQRDEFEVADSGFDAGAAYAFFKRRFAHVQHADEAVAYAHCPERDVVSRGGGLALSDVLRALMG